MEKFRAVVDPVKLIVKLITRVISVITNFVEPINILKSRKRKLNEATQDYDSEDAQQVATNVGDAPAVGSQQINQASVVPFQTSNAPPAVPQLLIPSPISQGPPRKKRKVPVGALQPVVPQVLIPSPIYQGPPRKKTKVSATAEVPFKERRESFLQKAPVFCINYPVAEATLYLNVFSIKRDWSENVQESHLETLHLGIISSEKIPMINDFCISSNLGSILTERKNNNQEIIMTSIVLKQIENFHRVLFEKFLKIADEKAFNPEEAQMKILVVPAKETGHEFAIDFELMKILTPFNIPKDFSAVDALKNIYTKICCIPEIIYRIKQLLLSEELRQKISSDRLIGITEFPENAILEVVYFNKTCKVKSEDIVLDSTYTIKFHPNNILDNYGPSPFSILHAATLKLANEQYNLERFEILGDAFLEYVAAIKCLFENPQESYASLALMCISKVNNMNLHEKAKKKNLQAYLIYDYFNEKCTETPLYINKTEKNVNLLSKCLSDLVESLIGIYIIKSGQYGGLAVMTWLGLEPIPNKHKIVKEDLLNFPDNFKIPEHPSIAYPAGINIVIEQLEKKLHYTFVKKFWLLKAITDCSYVSTTEHIYNNKQLTFIGQRILAYIVTRILVEDRRDLTPGIITKFKGKMIKAKYHAFLCIKFKLHEYLQQRSLLIATLVENIKGKQDYKCFEVNGYIPESFESPAGPGTLIFADLFRAVAGAVYFDSRSLNRVLMTYHEMMKPALDYLQVDCS